MAGLRSLLAACVVFASQVPKYSLQTQLGSLGSHGEGEVEVRTRSATELFFGRLLA